MELFDELRGAGQLDSQGKFTLAGDKALEKMRRFQLRESSHYLLFAIRAVVAGGAQQVQIRHSSTSIRILARHWNPPERDEWLSAVFESPEERPVEYYLGVVANHVKRLQVDPDGLTIEHQSGLLRNTLLAWRERMLLSSLRTTAPREGWGARLPGRLRRAKAQYASRARSVTAS